VNVTHSLEAEIVLTSTPSEVANGSPVGIEEVPYVPEWAYSLTYIFPVGLPYFLRDSRTVFILAPCDAVNDWDTPFCPLYTEPTFVAVLSSYESISVVPGGALGEGLTDGDTLGLTEGLRLGENDGLILGEVDAILYRY